ncbi:hypothetical protein Tco_0472837 [Tanacetum coccineum]
MARSGEELKMAKPLSFKLCTLNLSAGLQEFCSDEQILTSIITVQNSEFTTTAMNMYNIYTVKRSSRNQRCKRQCCSLILAESNSLSHAHTQATKTYYKHQDSRIKNAQNTKTSVNSDIQDLPKSYQDYQDNDCQGRLLASFQDDT